MTAQFECCAEAVTHLASELSTVNTISDISSLDTSLEEGDTNPIVTSVVWLSSSPVLLMIPEPGSASEFFVVALGCEETVRCTAALESGDVSM